VRDELPVATGPAADTGKRSVGSWLVYGAIILAVVTDAVFGVLSLFAPASFLSIVGVHSEQLSASAHVYAAYTGTRELAIAVTLIVLLAMRATRGLAAVMLLTALANALDVVNALAAQRWVQVPGALVFALIYFATAVWLFRRSAGGESA
jgi:hypothetical protein